MGIRTAHYVIIGAGSAGARSPTGSPKGRHQVLLLEAGGETHPSRACRSAYVGFTYRPA